VSLDSRMKLLGKCALDLTLLGILLDLSIILKIGLMGLSLALCISVNFGTTVLVDYSISSYVRIFYV